MSRRTKHVHGNPLPNQHCACTEQQDRHDEFVLRWNEHQGCGFPSSYGGFKLGNQVLAQIDAELHTCVSSYVNKRHLNEGICAWLKSTAHQLESVLPTFNEEARRYFGRAAELARLAAELAQPKHL